MTQDPEIIVSSTVLGRYACCARGNFFLRRHNPDQVQRVCFSADAVGTPEVFVAMPYRYSADAIFVNKNRAPG
jgi:hypothetical protein